MQCAVTAQTHLLAEVGDETAGRHCHDVAKVDPTPKAADKWNVYEITAQGRISS
jgi:hypothetical protein